MDIRKILADLRSERDRLDQAIAAMEAISPDGSKPAVTAPRRMTAAGRKRISDAAKARWAEHRREASRPRRHISAAGRKRLSAMMKARWAARRKAKTK